ncbi:MAG: Non-hemolytic phospholipase C precursor [Candidatus Heimdallarchaeota archaeon LC_2]|nr:MAG: Non-hemolytic phospholipase C precursor [Candidatus Heimdallarchaeota archaeon LC_2]
MVEWSEGWKLGIVFIQILVATSWVQIFVIRIRSPSENKRITLIPGRRLYKIIKTDETIKDQIRTKRIVILYLTIFVVLTAGYYVLLENYVEDFLNYLLALIVLSLVVYVSLFLMKKVKSRYFVLFGFYFIPMSMLNLNMIRKYSNNQIIDLLDWSFGIPLTSQSISFDDLVSLLLPLELIGNFLNLEPTGFAKLLVVAIIFVVTFLFYIYNQKNSSEENDLLFYIWKQDQFIPYSRVHLKNKPTILLLHGLSGSLNTWQSQNEIYERNNPDVRIMDYLKEKSKRDKTALPQIIAIKFTNQLRDELSAKYRVDKSEWSRVSVNMDLDTSTIELNNYTWELLSVLDILHGHDIKNIHVIAHSTGGLVIRDLFYNIYNSDGNLNSLQSDFKIKESNDKKEGFISDITFLSVPHFGAQGGRAIINHFSTGLWKLNDGTLPNNKIEWIVDQFKFVFKIVFSLIKIILLPAYFGINNLTRRLVAMGEDAQAALDLDVNSPYLQMLNEGVERGTIKLYNDKIKWRNAVAIWDLIVGQGQELSKNNLLEQIAIEQQFFNADHANFVIENMEQFFRGNYNSTPSIHHSRDVYNWIFEDIKTSSELIADEINADENKFLLKFIKKYAPIINFHPEEGNICCYPGDTKDFIQKTKEFRPTDEQSPNLDYLMGEERITFDEENGEIKSPNDWKANIDKKCPNKAPTYVQVWKEEIDGITHIQIKYWFWYQYNSYPNGLWIARVLRKIGRMFYSSWGSEVKNKENSLAKGLLSHEGDWESFEVRIIYNQKTDRHKSQFYIGRHGYGSLVSKPQTMKCTTENCKNSKNHKHPLLWSALGSHGIYAKPNRWKFFEFIDRVQKSKIYWQTCKSLVYDPGIKSDHSFNYFTFHYKNKWGKKEELTGGPSGIRTKARWKNDLSLSGLIHPRWPYSKSVMKGRNIKPIELSSDEPDPSKDINKETFLDESISINTSISQTYYDRDSIQKNYPNQYTEIINRQEEINQRNEYLENLKTDDSHDAKWHFQQNINHIVILMLENRSFDNMLGYLSIDKTENQRSYPINGIDLINHYNIYENKRKISISRWLPGSKKTKYSPKPMKTILQEGRIKRRITKFLGRSIQVPRFPVDPPHSFENTQKQIVEETDKDNNNRVIANAHFVKNFVETPFYKFNTFQKKKPGAVMGYYTREEVPIFDYLKRHYFACDHWYSTIPGPTSANRAFAIAGTSVTSDHISETQPDKNEIKLSDNKNINNAVNTILPPKNKYVGTTIFELLTKIDKTWKYYFHDFAQLWTFEMFYDQLDSNEEIACKDSLANFSSFDRFIEDVVYSDGKALKHRTLANVSWIDPDFGSKDPTTQNDDHSKADISQGQRLVAKVLDGFYDSESKTDGQWRDIFYETLIFVIYDEHGGFYDHMKPPHITEDENHPAKTYGVRVPAFIISPFIDHEYIKETYHNNQELFYHHTTLLRTILDRFDCDDESMAFLDPNVQKSIPLDYKIFNFKKYNKNKPFDPKEIPSKRPLNQNFIGQIVSRVKKFWLTLKPGSGRNDNQDLFSNLFSLHIFRRILRRVAPYSTFIIRNQSVEALRSLLDEFGRRFDYIRTEVIQNYENEDVTPEDLRIQINRLSIEERRGFFVHLDDLNQQLSFEQDSVEFLKLWFQKTFPICKKGKTKINIDVVDNYVDFTEFDFAKISKDIVLNLFIDFILEEDAKYKWKYK